MAEKTKSFKVLLQGECLNACKLGGARKQQDYDHTSRCSKVTFREPLMRGLLTALACLLALSMPIATLADDTAKPADTADKKTEAKTWEWVFIYYMAYDNNLDRFGRPILDMLKEGVKNESVAVVTFADFRDKDGMKRYETTTKGETLTQLETEDSADEATLKAQLEWTRDNYKAKRYAVVFLDHGGRLSEMSQDLGPGPSKREWLHSVKVANVLTDWRKSLAGKLELVFIQQCGKGTLENYHAFRLTAPYIMGSQTVVGAPNHYYTSMLEDVCKDTDIDGKQLAELVRKHETNNMFTTYTVVNDKALEALPEKLDAVLKPLLSLKELKPAPILPEEPRHNETVPEGAYCRMCFQPGRDERMVDGAALLAALYEANELDKKPLDDFRKWMKEELITGHKFSPRHAKKAGDWCGFSIYMPGTTDALDRYRKDYPIYKDTTLDELLAKLVD